jgi:hypothetical protein
MPSGIKRYLIGKGWTEIKDFPRTDVWLFNDAKISEQILVPKENGYELYPSDLLRIVEKLQHVEHRDIGLIVTQLQHPDVDIVRYRIQSSQTETGTLPLNAINKFIVSVVNSFKAAIADCINPNLHHPRMGGTRLDQLLEQAQFGQTEHGSYVVKIIAPVFQKEQLMLFSDGSLVENEVRKGVVHLLKSTHAMICAIENEEAEQFVVRHQKHPTISDNFVNAIADMQLSDDSSLEITSDWSPMIQVPSIPSRVKIKPEYFESISGIGCRLSPKPENRTSELLTGFVTQLEGTPDETGKPEGYVTIDILTPDQGHFSVYAYLSQSDHQKAILAYQNTIPVNFSGKLLRKSARRREIIEINNFSLSQPIGNKK